MLHDIALRPAVLNAAKIFPTMMFGLRFVQHFGAEYRDELVPVSSGCGECFKRYESKLKLR